MSGNMSANPIAFEAIKKFRNGDLVRLDGAAALLLRNQPRTFDLCLTLRSFEAMPAALALAGHGILGVQDDRPMAWAALAEMALHFCLPLISVIVTIALLALRRSAGPKSLAITASAPQSSFACSGASCGSRQRCAIITIKS